jgi:hypothetical protein
MLPTDDHVRLRALPVADHADEAVHWATAQSKGFAYQAHEIDVFHLASGLITEFWSFSEKQRAADTLWSERGQ